MGELDKLIAGYQRFHDNFFAGEERLYAQLSQGQRPGTLVIACSDSRVDPAIVMDCKPGDLFVIRNVANLVPPYEVGGGYHGVSAALEFGIGALEISHIVVLGHRQCGGIRALVQGVPEGLKGEFIRPWMNIARRARERAMAEHPHASVEELACACELAGILVSLENLMTFPWIKARVDEGKLQLHGWFLDIETGVMSSLDPVSRRFKPLV